MSELDLRARIRAILDDTGEADPGVVADKVIGDLSSRELRPALAQTMRALVREVMRAERLTTPQAAENVSPGQGRSRARAVAEAWRAHLRDRVFVGDGTWRLLGDCSPQDVLFLVADRRQKAAELAEAAQRYQRLHDAMDRHGAGRVADLPDAVLADALGDAA